VAIADIITRIEDDARAEADAIISAARERADAVRERARIDAEREAERIVERTLTQAKVEADTLLANARLAARDSLLAAKKDLAERALTEAETRLESLPDDEYAALIAREVAKVAVPGQRVRVSAADGSRLSTLDALLRDAGVDVTVEDGSADVDRGVCVEGDGVRVEVSAASYIAEHRADLLHVAVGVLFSGEDR
jgi:V/A-type H+-transporting ATPase subunit E